MARRKKVRVSGWAMLAMVVFLGFLLGPTVAVVCFCIALVNALRHSD